MFISSITRINFTRFSFQSQAFFKILFNCVLHFYLLFVDLFRPTSKYYTRLLAF